MSDMLSQDEIDALLNGTGSSDSGSGSGGNGGSGEDLNPQEIDALGEIGNISMGTSATTLSSLLNDRVAITTPKVSVMTWAELMEQHARPYIVAKVEFTEGLVGTNLLILNIRDVKIITSLMLGEGSAEPEDLEITELHLSAISEAMNQMVGSACTSISSMIGMKIDISPPVANQLDLSTDDGTAFGNLNKDDRLVKISFRMTVGDLIDSEIMQILPLSFAKSMIDSILVQDVPEPQVSASQPEPQAAPPVQDFGQSQPNYAPQPDYNQAPPQGFAPQPNYNQAPPMQPNYGYQQDYGVQYAAAAMPNMNLRPPEPPRAPVNVQPVQFQNLEDTQYAADRENIGLIMDVPLQVTVELGRTSRLIREVLEFGPGSIVELDKLAGEPVDILVNGKAIAKGEVVVIDESFGVRITDIIHPSKRI